MAAFINLIGRAGSPKFEYMLKLDDDNAVDLARIVCAVATLSRLGTTYTLSPQLGQACADSGMGGVHPFSDLQGDDDAQRGRGIESLRLRAAGLVPREGSYYGKAIPGVQPALWWSSFRQAKIQYRRPYGSYYVAGETADLRGAQVSCVEFVPTNTGAAISTPTALPTVLETAKPLRVGTYYELYGFGGSHVVSARVLQWLALHPEALSTDIWMEDVSFGVWLGAYARAHAAGSLYLVDDPRWMETAYGPCVGASLAMNLGGEKSGVANLAGAEQQNLVARKHMELWEANLQGCDNGCGCSSSPMDNGDGGDWRKRKPDPNAPPPLKLPNVTMVDAAACYAHVT